MSAKVLRRAASLMRERANAAETENDYVRGVAKLGRLTPKGIHMAGMSPAVALAVADWLDMFAAVAEAGHDVAFMDHAVEVAGIYLGDDQ